MISRLSSKQHDKYDAFVAASGDSSIYHSRAWMEFICDTFRATPYTIVATQDEDIIGILPLAYQHRIIGQTRLVSLPFSHCVPALGPADVVIELWREASRISISELKCPLEIRAEIPGTERSYNSPFVNTRTELPSSFDEYQASIRDNTRQQLKQADKNPDLTARLASSDADFDAMDFIMAANRQQLGSTTYSKGFFKNLHNSLGEYLRMEIALIKDKPVALFVVSHFNNTAIYHYGASLASDSIRKSRPNNLLYRNAIEASIDRGAQVFDFGTSLVNQNGLIHYKEGWGGVTYPLLYTYNEETSVSMVPKPVQNSAFASIAGTALGKLPMPIYRILTPLITRELG